MLGYYSGTMVPILETGGELSVHVADVEASAPLIAMESSGKMSSTLAKEAGART